MTEAGVKTVEHWYFVANLMDSFVHGLINTESNCDNNAVLGI